MIKGNHIEGSKVGAPQSIVFVPTIFLITMPLTLGTPDPGGPETGLGKHQCVMALSWSRLGMLVITLPQFAPLGSRDL